MDPTRGAGCSRRHGTPACLQILRRPSDLAAVTGHTSAIEKIKKRHKGAGKSGPLMPRDRGQGSMMTLLSSGGKDMLGFSGLRQWQSFF